MPVAQALTATTTSSSSNNKTAIDGAAEGRTRLHITPLNPDLLKVFIPPSVLPHATGISYHTVQTFPEKGYGYVEIPTMDAKKLKNKLNGSILRGTKVRVEDARPEKRKRMVEGQAAEGEGAGAEEKPVKKVKKVKGDRKKGILPGFELPDERQVKRGWTEPESHSKERKKDKKEKRDKKDKRKEQEKSKYTKEPEMLFRTSLPPNAVPTPSSKPDKSLEKPKKAKKSSRDVVVHEFAKTTKHATFLKGNQVAKDAKTTAEFVEGKGWVDEEGNVVEPEAEHLSKRRKAKEQAKAERKRAAEPPAPADAETVPSGKSSAQRISDALEAKRKPAKLAASAPDAASDSADASESDAESSVVSASSSDVSSSSGSEDEDSVNESEAASSSEAESDTGSEETTTEAPAQTQTASAGADTDMPDAATPKEVHPLEALFKRPKPSADAEAAQPLAPLNTSFSFFGGGGDEDEDEVADADATATAPHTPYARRDMRSAAPTPDTAAIGRKFPWHEGEYYDDDEGEEYGEEYGEGEGEEGYADEGGDAYMLDANTVPLGAREGNTAGAAGAAAAGAGDAEQSDFARHFWEQRGEYNRAWKKRRRESLKVQRQRENRRLGRKVV
ncbi:uncharacterized protein K452DRAFT_293091 [Aplosporella prunicola CBS 121167]|uniref:RRM domain-containing protein n=1 Tax=Aplosporella prunicola CBS 121167 TaxID=1176127 RepID=A0A6A6AXB4_9PEZI|nr:uncharacterized protein K452DRAFT_293091 [Aplosporella prunicola CBS 121167]KAF2135625.1 hypothetical protein K452DRAFT_293091 [Aplosporella prunicola CBS 121167]